MKTRTTPFDDHLQKFLSDPREAAGYLDTVLEEGDPEMFLIALRDVAEAQGGLARLARLTHLNRANLYRILSKQGNPEIYTLVKLLDQLGFRLSISAKAKPRHKPLRRAA